MSKSVQDLVRRVGSRDEAVMELVRMVQSGDIGFPFAAGYLPDAGSMLDNFRTKQPDYDFKQYRQLAAYNTPNRLFLPPTFREGYAVIHSAHDPDYEVVNGLTDLFIEDQRIKSRKVYSDKSTVECWTDPQCLTDIMTVVVDKHPDYDVKSLREAVYEISPDPGLFKLMWVKGLLAFLAAEEIGAGKCRMLDMSSGWGDRLMAAIGMGCEYLGFDPNTDLKKGHDSMISVFGDPSKQRVVYEPFEEADLSTEPEFDISIISPPFFNIEIYQGGKQSIDKFPSITDWIVGFLFVSLQKIWSKLKDGGYLAIHMGDPKNMFVNEPMMLFIEQYLPGSSYEGVIGVIGDKGNPAPVWIWQKVDGGLVKKWNPDKIKERSLANLYPEISERFLASSSISYANAIDHEKFAGVIQGITDAYNEAITGMPPGKVAVADQTFRSKFNLIPIYLMSGKDSTVVWIRAMIEQTYAGLNPDQVAPSGPITGPPQPRERRTKTTAGGQGSMPKTTAGGQGSMPTQRATVTQATTPTQRTAEQQQKVTSLLEMLGTL